MFTGIIKNIGIIKKIEKKAEGLVFFVSCSDIFNQIKVADSVCTTGVCLTVFDKEDDCLLFEIMPETLRKTTLGEKTAGNKINLETSLKVGDELGGHFVYGHVDCVGLTTNIVQEGNNKLVTIELPAEWMKYLAPEGSVAVDGVSLTVARIHDKKLVVSLIEYTLDNTTLGDLQIGDKVNVEMDMLAKYVATQIMNLKS